MANDALPAPEPASRRPDAAVPGVLLVDDRPANLLALEAVLAPLGLRLVRASSGAEALERLTAQSFAAVVLDVQMPGMNGFELAARIRRHEPTREVPLLFLTATRDDAAEQLEAYSYGAVDYITRPINAEVLRAKVAVLVELWQRGETLRQREAQLHARERDQLQYAVHRGAEQLRLILDGVRDHAISMLDREGCVLTCNAPAEAITGFALAEVQGRFYGLFFTPEDRAAHLPERELATARTRERYDGEGFRQRKDGSRFYAMVSLSALRDADGELVGFVKVTQDISERRRLADEARAAREQAELERARLRQMFDAVPAMITLLRGPELRYEFISPPSVAETHLPREQIVGRRVEDVVPEVPESVAAFKRSYATGEALHRAEVPVTRDYGRGPETRYYTSSIVPLRDARGEVDALLVFSHDVTDQVRARHAVQEANDRLTIVLEGVGDGITMVDAAGAIVYANEAAARILGFASVADLRAARAAELLARFELLDADGRPVPADRWPTQRAFRGERAIDELICLRSRADPAAVRWSILSSIPMVDAGGGVPFVINVLKDVTEQRRAAAAMRESEKRFRAVFDNALDAILIIDDAQHVVEANGAACELFGRTRDELLRCTSADLVPPQERAATGPRIASLLARGQLRAETAIQRGDGSVRRVEFSSTANIVPGRHLSVLRDVTERRRAEASLEFLAEASAILASSLEYERTLSAVVRLCVPTIADWAAVDMLLDAERGLKRVAVAHVDAAKTELAHEIRRRWPPDLAAPHGVARVLRTGQPELLSEIPDALLQASIADPELLAMVRQLGLASSMIVPLTVRDRIVGVITLATAESGRHFSPDDLRLAQEVARRAGVAIENATSYREATEANRLRDEFLATVSHELRTPLTAVLGWAAMVRTRQDDPAYVARGLETIERNARAQVQLIEDLLDISRAITGKLRLEVKPVELGAVVQTALDTIRPAAAAKGITVTSVLDPDAGTIMGDADRLLQVINNLLTNAVKFTPRGGRVRVYVRRVASSVEVVVQDSGQGIKPEFLPYVFERFRQADASLTRAAAGLGLGLAISKSLVEMHGGTITAESDGEGQGATFTVRIPVAPLRSSAMPPPTIALDAPSAGPALECPADLAGLRVLAVDDERDTRELLQSVLEHCHATVRAASSAAEALQLLRDERFDLIVSDIGMPGDDGYSFIRKVRALPESQGGRTPAVALTAHASTADRTRALMAGFQTHVAKPVEPQELIIVLANVLGRLTPAPPG